MHIQYGFGNRCTKSYIAMDKGTVDGEVTVHMSRALALAQVPVLVPFRINPYEEGPLGCISISS